MIVIDYLQLMRPTTGSRSENRVQEISDITRGLKAIAKELDVPVSRCFLQYYFFSSALQGRSIYSQTYLSSYSTLYFFKKARYSS